MMQIPTRIISTPKKENYRGRRLIVCHCDNGEKYPLLELAGLVGLPVSTMTNRLANMGWDDPRIFELERQENKARIETGNAEWAALGRRVRSENFSRLHRHGKFEQAGS
jgi:hypothetical protein